MQPLRSAKLSTKALVAVAGAGVLSVVAMGPKVVTEFVAPRVLGATASRAATLPQPAITSAPADVTSDTSARFTFTDSQQGATFECGLDKAKLAACTSGVVYDGLKETDHAFSVRATDRTGATSPATTYAWTIVKKTNFAIAGTMSQPLAPGVSSPLNLGFTNPYNFDITVDQVGVTILDGTTRRDGSANPSCNGSANLVIASPFTGGVLVPANSSVTLSATTYASHRPILRMVDLPSNQDGCKDAVFEFSYAGLASKP